MDQQTFEAAIEEPEWLDSQDATPPEIQEFFDLLRADEVLSQ